MTIPIYVRRADGTEFFVGLREPLTRDTPADAVLREVRRVSPEFPVVLCDEIMVSRNLPAATNHIFEEISRS